MSSMTEKVKGKANEVAGSVKKSIGKAAGDSKLTAEGDMQRGKGVAQQAVGKAKDAVKSAIDRA